MPRKQTREEFIQKSIDIFGDQLLYHKVIYIDSATHVILVCVVHGDFIITPTSHLSDKRGCYICSGVRYDTNSFIEKAIKIHGDRYSYVKSIFNGVKNNVVIICEEHGEFLQKPDKHINAKQGCPKCDKSCQKNWEYVLGEATRIHGNLYSYKLSQFTTMFSKIEIICEIHGSFWQTPANHIYHSQGCPKCATEDTRLTIDEFMEKARKIHGDEYDYSFVIYVNNRTKVEIICKKHGSFFQTPGAHLAGTHCPKCTGHISREEKEWLDGLGSAGRT